MCGYFIARKGGTVVAQVTDLPDFQEFVATAVLSWIRAGFDVLHDADAAGPAVVTEVKVNGQNTVVDVAPALEEMLDRAKKVIASKREQRRAAGKAKRIPGKHKVVTDVVLLDGNGSIVQQGPTVRLGRALQPGERAGLDAGVGAVAQDVIGRVRFRIEGARPVQSR